MADHLEFGSIAVGAPGSKMRAKAEREDRYQHFWEVYTEELYKAVESYPEEYRWPLSEVTTVVGRMVTAYDKGSYSKDSRAYKTTCKRLGIKHTYQAIREFIEQGKK